MFSKLNLIYILLFVGMLELPSAVSYEDEEHEEHELLHVGWDVRCKLQPNSWTCHKNKTNIHEFYYDVTMQGCKTFRYGGCDLAFNGFSTLTECNNLCSGVGNEALTPEKVKSLSMEVVCRFQKEFGSCFNYQPSFYYDISTRSCKGFSYSGCGGNGNRFESSLGCMEACESVMPKFKLVKPRIRK